MKVSRLKAEGKTKTFHLSTRLISLYAKYNEDARIQASSFISLSTLPSVLRASGEFIYCGSQYTVSGNSCVMRQHTTAGSDFRFV